MRRQVKITDKTRSVEFDDMFSYGSNGRIKVNTGATTTINNVTHTIEIVPGAGSGIPILASAPAAVAGTINPWMLDTDYSAGNYKIGVVFPDGTFPGLTAGHFLKALSATTFGFAAHGLTYGDVGADASGAASTVQGNLNTHAGLTTTAHGLGASAFHADNYFALASHAHAWSDITSGVPTTWTPIAHNLLSAYHGDTTAASVVRGDIITGQGASPKWVRLAISVPASGLMNYFGAANGDTEPGYKALFDATVPGTIAESAAAAAGSATVAARRDHTHGAPATWKATAHSILDSTYHSDVLTGSITRGDILYGNSTPKIARLAKGTSGYLLTCDANDVKWDSLANIGIQPLDSDLTAIAGISCARGSIITGQTASPAWTGLALGTTGKLLGSNGTDLVYDTLANWGIAPAAHGVTIGTIPKAATSTTWGNSCIQQANIGYGEYIGINTSPTQMLHIKGTGSNGVMLFEDVAGVQMYQQANGNADARIGTLSDHPLLFMTHNVERVRYADTYVQYSVPLGIGTVPTQLLHIKGATGSALMLFEDVAGAQIYMQANANVDARLGTLSNHPLLFLPNNVQKMKIDVDGTITMNAYTSGILKVDASHRLSCAALTAAEMSNLFTSNTTNKIAIMSETNKIGNSAWLAENGTGVGIGMTAPNQKVEIGSGGIRLSLNGAATTYYAEWVPEYLGAGNGFRYNFNIKDFYGGTTGGSALTIYQNGFIGIGAAFPESRLDIRYLSDVCGIGALRLGSVGGGVRWVFRPGDALGELNLDRWTGSAYTTDVTFKAGAVGIGTAAPGYLLDVGNGATALQQIGINALTYSSLVLQRAGVAKWSIINNFAGLDDYCVYDGANSVSGLNLWPHRTGTYDGTGNPFYSQYAGVQNLTYTYNKDANGIVTSVTTAFKAPAFQFDVAGACNAGDYCLGRNTSHNPTLVFVGDSMTFGYGATHPPSYYSANDILPYNGIYPDGFNLGITGRQIVQMNAYGWSVEGQVFQSASGINTIVVWGGINDLNLGYDPAVVFSELQAYCSRLSKNGWKVVVCSLPSAGDQPGGAAGLDTIRLVYNGYIRKSWAQFADAFADLAADPNIGPNVSYTNSTYYQTGGLHLKDAGNVIVGALQAAAINAANSDNQLQQWTPVLTGWSGTPSVAVYYQRNRNKITINFNISGTGSGNTTAMTLPHAGNASVDFISTVASSDNGGTAPGLSVIYAGTSSLTFYPTMSAINNWTTGTSRAVIGQITYFTH